MEEKILLGFKNREIRAREIFEIKQIEKNVAYNFVKEYHYLGEAKFFSKIAYGLYHKEELVGVATFSNPQGIGTLKGWFGYTNDNQSVLELSRLCMIPYLNGTNATSYLLGNSMKLLKKHEVDAVITLADSNHHVGSIYQVCNFKYYGLTDKKTDFFTCDGRVNPRGSTKDVQGVWLPRTRKHRYCYVINKDLTPKYNQMEYPKKEQTIKITCCEGSKKVYDKRYGVWYTCPVCTGEIQPIENP